MGGGLTNAGVPAWDSVYAYDARTNRWVPKPDLPATRNFACALLHTDGKIHLLGGSRAGGGLLPLDEVEAFDVEEGWEPRAPLARARRDLACAMGGDGFPYAITGTGIGLSPSDTWEVSTPNGWVLGSSAFPAPRWGGRAATGPDGRIYFTGGLFSAGGTPDTLVFDPGAPEAGWRALAPMNQPRFLHGAAFGSDGHLYVVGGAGERELEEPIPLSLVERYSIVDDTWTIVASMPDFRFDVTAVLGPGGRLYVAGGGGNMTASAYADLFVYDVAEDRWYP
jgi:N-acetylneuraminic acid mutarotase